MHTTNLFTGLLWDQARGTPIDVVKKREKRVLVTRNKKNILFDASIFEEHILDLLKFRNDCRETDREELKSEIKKKVAKICCFFEEVDETWNKTIRIAKVQIVYRHQSEDVLRGRPKKEDQFFLLNGSNVQEHSEANSSWEDLQSQWDYRHMRSATPVTFESSVNTDDPDCPW